MVISDDSQYVVTGSYDKTCRVWSLNSGNLLRIFSGHTNWVTSVSISYDNQCIVTASEDCTCRVYDGINLDYAASIEDIIMLQKDGVDTSYFLSQSPELLCQSTRDNDFIFHDIIKTDDIQTFQKYMKLKPVSVFAKCSCFCHSMQDNCDRPTISKEEIQDISLLKCAILHNADKCIAEILQVLLLFLRNDAVLEQYAAYEREDIQLPYIEKGITSHRHYFENIDINDFHDIASKRKYASMFISFIKNLKELRQSIRRI